jgi:predicted outer membrane protein
VIAPILLESFRSLNPLLIESDAFRCQFQGILALWLYAQCVSLTERQGCGARNSMWRSPRVYLLNAWGSGMALLSRSFIRRRIISLATTLSVSAISFAMAQDPTGVQHHRAAVPDANEQDFLLDHNPAASTVSNSKLVEATGDVDRDFVAMMIPHHQRAIEVARAELKHGHNPELRRLAQKVLTERQNEISELQLAIGAASATSPVQ